MPYEGEYASAGAHLRALIRRAGLNQNKVAEALDVDPTYVSQMVNDKVIWTNSSYFRALVRILGLSEQEVRELKPEVVIDITASQGDTPAFRGPIPPPRLPQDEPLVISPALQEVIDRHGMTYPELRDPVSLRKLTRHHFFDGGEIETPDDWLDFFLTVRRYLR